MPILKVAAPEIVSGVSGESEQKLRDLFDQAVVSQPLLMPACHPLQAFSRVCFSDVEFFILLTDLPFVKMLSATNSK